MTISKNILAGAGAVAKAYEIEQSIIFDEASHVSSMVRTPSSTGNRKTWTLSVWLKRVDFATGSPNGYQMLYGAQAAHECTIRIVDNKLEVYEWTGSAYNFKWFSTRELRDPSAWYHVVVAFDSTQGTSTNRLKVYINGEQQTVSNLAYPSQNLDTRMNLAGLAQYIGRYHNPAYSYNGYMAEFNWLDGTAKAASDFGETNSDTGQWIPKEYTGGSYGTNGFYLKFASGAIGTDSSGQGNTQTTANIAEADVVLDSPTNNFATWNPANLTPYYAFAAGNLKLTVPNQWRNAIATMGVSTGKWYWEQIVSASSTKYCNPGFVTDRGFADNSAGTYLGYKAWSWGYDGSNGKIWHNAAGTTQLTVAPTTQWKAGVALDLDNGKAWFSLNGVWMGTGANPSTGAGAAFSSLTTGINYYPATTIYNLNSTANFGQDGTFGGLATAQGNADTNGIGNFFYPVPTGFKALCTNNLPEPAITPKEHFNAVLYAGDNTTGRQITGVGFQPDLVWLKNRSVTNYHTLFDSVRGVTNYLFANDVSGEQSNSSSVTAFTSDGITVNHNASFGNNNANSSNYVTWNWKAGGTEPVKTYVVKVVSDSGNKYRFDDFAASSQTVDLQEGGTYTFDQSDSSNSGHPFRLSITNNGTHGGGSEYTTGVVTTGSPGSAGAKTVITVAASAPVLYYYCSVHSGMGGQIRTSPNSAHGSSYFDGDIKSTVSANQESGFSIVNYEPNGTASATVPHGLGVAPEMVFYKRYNSSSSWFCWTTVIDGSNDYLVLNGQDTLATVSQAGGTSFTSSFIRATNYANNSEAVAYCFASKPGFSKIGVYTGNGVADGPFVYTGFKPAWVMRKRVTGGNADWFINGGKINPVNASVSGTGIANISLWANNPSVDEAAGEIAYGLDLLSNGFKTTASAHYLNDHNSIYLYMAFAESPFKYANAR